ncbi:MAG TPA: CDGSH iron-sulfur domain-containing protein [Solirubrobacterales bacterium]|jgi:CDGSH-type Zn-finger protein|nr:CDGSH iron-sulfur domain-containing protein [Solirubrobacterales bacterium]
MSKDSREKVSPAASPVTITPYRDGPYLIRGDFVVQDQEGNEMSMQRRTIALCRCGKSRMRPLCDGTHRLTGFEAPSALEQWPEQEAGDVAAPGQG